jgi:uncharacterized protein (TIGR03437 family)
MMLLRCLSAFLLAGGLLAAQNIRVLSWQDEFDGPALDLSKWTHDVGGHGWGNNELQYYTSRADNAYIENGMLVIKAIRETYTGPNQVTRQYTSARLTTKGKFSQAYGRFEARIKVPYGQGIWPAFWMLGEEFPMVPWPDSGEIDIMEHIGREPANYYGTIHGPGHSGANGIGFRHTLPAGTKGSDDFRIYAVEWTPERIRWFVDDIEFGTVTPVNLPPGARWVYDRPFHLLLNVAVGGNWPGNPDNTTVFPQIMLVDYVRVYHLETPSEDRPQIGAGGVVNGAGSQRDISAGSWVSIYGSRLSPVTREWSAAEMAGGKLPTELDGVSVLINGKPAYPAYISPTQINAVAGDIGSGPAVVEVRSAGKVSGAATAQASTYSPAFFLWSGKYVAATRTDFTPAAKSGLFGGGVSSRPAMPGEVLILWGTGFGPTSPSAPVGALTAGAPEVTVRPVVKIGGHEAAFISAVLSPGYAGLFQVAVEVPQSLAPGDHLVTAEVSGQSSPGEVYLTVGP